MEKQISLIGILMVENISLMLDVIVAPMKVILERPSPMVISIFVFRRCMSCCNYIYSQSQLYLRLVFV